MIYAYARVSTKTQRLDRQIKNLMDAFPQLSINNIFCEKYTGTKLDGRKEFNRLYKIVKEGDIIVFDSVSRMSRNADEGCDIYFDLYDRGVNLIFLKEPHINTSVYKQSLNKQLNIKIESGNATTDKFVSGQIQLLNDLLSDLARQQIRIAFEQSEKEVKDLHKRVSEGMLATQRKNALLPDKQKVRIGNQKGDKLHIKKKEPIKADIKRLSKNFDGTNTDVELIKILGIARNTYYKYKKELSDELAQE